ncbi:hypothetical protein RRG08_037615 [Elysia crispata]|uniref:Uncharacterized protein n=1 Tax=Elysia crispata TaxID=231223 RepID=A0AAE0YHC1_9GAST|nr:hypothetical protein RRG08_037615 [Elysia crispata]
MRSSLNCFTFQDNQGRQPPQHIFFLQEEPLSSAIIRQAQREPGSIIITVNYVYAQTSQSVLGAPPYLPFSHRRQRLLAPAVASWTLSLNQIAETSAVSPPPVKVRSESTWVMNILTARERAGPGKARMGVALGNNPLLEQ